MVRRSQEVKGLKIPGKQGPFGVLLFNTEETCTIGTEAASGNKPIHKQYVDICQKALCYVKSGKLVYPPQQKTTMDNDIGGGKIVQIAQQAMKFNGLMDDSDLNEKVKEAEKN